MKPTESEEKISSAKIAVLQKGSNGKSEVKIEYRIGPKTDPCGTPASY